MNKDIENIMANLEKIEYGFKDNDGNNIVTDEKKWEENFNNFYYLQSPEELLEKNCGVCWDQVELERKLFEEKEINFNTYFIYIDDDNYLPSHTFLVYKEKDKYYWFEHSWYDCKGIFQYDDFDKLISDIKNKFISSKKDEIHGNFELKIYEYDKPKYGITCDEFYEFIFKQKLIYKEKINL